MPSGPRSRPAQRPAHTTTAGAWISPPAVRTPVTRSPAVRIASTGMYWTTVAPSSRARVAKAFVVIAASA